MSGHVFHPGHQELHGVTVVVRTTLGQTVLGRYHEQNERGLLMRDVAIHEAADGDVEGWLDRQRKFGIQVAHRHLLLPPDQVAEVLRFGSASM